MRAVEPKKLHEGGTFIVIAKDQPEYESLPASVDCDGPLQPLTVEVVE